jgi:subtilisin family serine protease
MGVKAVISIAVVVASFAAQANAAPPVETILASDEFRKHQALALINAHYAYAAGASGKGVVIAFIDSGIDPAFPDITPNLSPKSVDIVEGRGELTSSDAHGLGAAVLAAGAFNGEATMGVAHEATILAIRTDNEAACGGACTYRSEEMAAALDYAVDNGAHVINLSIVGDDRLKRPFVEALKRAAAAGVIIVAAGGNSRGSQLTYPARYATEEGIAGLLIAAGNHDAQGNKVTRANRAGAAREYYITAPAYNSSQATAYVSGAVALVREAFPALTPAEAVEAVRAGARDAGKPGVDNIYGRGQLDLRGAFDRAAAIAAAK